MECPVAQRVQDCLMDIGKIILSTCSITNAV